MIEVLIGPIASGKSTYSGKRAKEGALIVNDDSIVMALHAGNYSLYDKALKPLYKGIENQIVAHSITLGRDVVIDRGTNSRRESRLRWMGLAKSLDSGIKATVFPNEGDLQHATRRFQSDSRGLSLDYWLKVASHHSSQYEGPSLSEGFDLITTLTPYSLREMGILN